MIDGQSGHVLEKQIVLQSAMEMHLQIRIHTNIYIYTYLYIYTNTKILTEYLYQIRILSINPIPIQVQSIKTFSFLTCTLAAKILGQFMFFSIVTTSYVDTLY